jgi:Domain of unknown function (DUF4183)
MVKKIGGNTIMPLQIMKLVVEVSTTVSTTPNSTRFFYTTTGDLTGPTSLAIDAADFFDDTGAAVTTLPTLNTNNSYFNVFINGILQMEDLSTYVPGGTGVGSLTITVPTGSDIISGSPVVLEIINFSPTSTSTVST